MKIIVVGTQISNIGNGIITKGAVAAVTQAFPDATIIESSIFPYYLSNTAVEQGGDPKLRDNGITVADFVDPDLVIFTGCILYPEALRQHKPLLELFEDTEVPIVFLGVGGNDYEADTISTVRELLRSVHLDLMISRDISAYKAYKDLFSEAIGGIDNGFFIDDWYNPPAADRSFIIATLDKTDYELPETDLPVVRPNHAPFDLLRDVYEGAGPLGKFLTAGRQLLSENELENAYNALRRGNLFVSASLIDYLFFYKNAEVVYTDRVHAAVPALIYSNKVKFSYETPRSELFDGTVIKSGEFYEIDREKLMKKKQRQIEALLRLFEGT